MEGDAGFVAIDVPLGRHLTLTNPKRCGFELGLPQVLLDQIDADLHQITVVEGRADEPARIEVVFQPTEQHGQGRNPDSPTRITLMLEDHERPGNFTVTPAGKAVLQERYGSIFAPQFYDITLPTMQEILRGNAPRLDTLLSQRLANRIPEGCEGYVAPTTAVSTTAPPEPPPWWQPFVDFVQNNVPLVAGLGGGLALLITATCVGCCCHRRRKRLQAEEAQAREPHAVELDISHV
jgi:hypothetical protein